MAEVHTKDVRCTWPAHIQASQSTIGTFYVVICQGVGAKGEQPPAPQSFTTRAAAQNAANNWVVTCGLTP